MNFIFRLLIFLSFCAQSQNIKDLDKFDRREGFFNVYAHTDKDEVYLEIKKLNEDFLYVHSLTTGVGSNDIGLDRGQIGDEAIVYFKKSGNKILLIEKNLKFRANTNNALERKSVQDAFAFSVLYGFEIKDRKDQSYIIDISDFLLQDRHQITEKLKNRKQGSYAIDKSKSSILHDRIKSFPKNVEIESLTTYKGNLEGSFLASVVPDSKNISVIQHHSFVKLPDEEFKKREFDPRSGALHISYLDYATPITEPIEKKFILKHRLEKKNNTLKASDPKEPIIYYLDPGTPEPIRSALIEGASWWNEAFTEIGFTNAFQVKMLPEDADPMDLRYNVIQWVHRSTRGWSYGASVIDPRTGEILKGHVSLGSLRIRQDFLIAQALSKEPFKNSDNTEAMLNLALARIRQLSAHEVGHTLGFAHNFAASISDRASVMDYPHPLIDIENNRISFRNAYDEGIGDWDKTTVAYSYSDFEESIKEKQALDQILKDSYDEGIRFISDSDARPIGGAHGFAHLWDNGKNPVDELKKVLNIRSLAIQNFSKFNIKEQETYTNLEDVFVPLYFFHRYQTEAAVKVIGGLDYNYATRDDNQKIVEILDKKQQKAALDVILKTISPEILAIPKDKLQLFPPRAFGYNRTRESFKSKTGVAFDPLSAADTASEMTLKLLLDPTRLSRLVQQKSVDENNLGLAELLENISNHVLKIENDLYYREIKNITFSNYIDQLKSLYSNKKVHPQVNASVYSELKSITAKMNTKAGKNTNDFYTYLRNEIDLFFENPEKFEEQITPKIPDGSPIGGGFCQFK